MAPITEVHVRAGDRVRRGAALVTLDARETPGATSAGRGGLARRPPKRPARRTPTSAPPNRRSSSRARRTTGWRRLQAKRSATAQELDQAVAALARRRGADVRRPGAPGRRERRTRRRAGRSGGRRRSARPTRCSPRRSTASSPSATPIPAPWRRPARRCSPWRIQPTFRLEVQLDEARAAVASAAGRGPARRPPAAGDGWIDGRVVEIARVDPASHSFLVKIDLPASAALRSGLFGRARFPGPTRRALTVPTAALIRRGQLTFVYVVDGEKRARLRPISTGRVRPRSH